MKKSKDIIPNTQNRSWILAKGPVINKEDIRITDEIISSWQKIVNSMTEIIDVPSAQIMKVDPPYIEVFVSCESRYNPYKAGDKKHLAGLYCEAVIKRKYSLLVPNALIDQKWDHNPDIKQGMISYLGVPILWPDGEVFGTLSVMDSKENRFEKRYERLMLRLKELVESHLSLLYHGMSGIKNREDILDNLSKGIIVHDTKRHILFFNRAAEKITGYKREHVLGKDCHEAFGGPFCGGRCAFREGTPDSIDTLSYPLNILTHEGQPRQVEISITDMKDTTGAFVGGIASFRDVTDPMGLKLQGGDFKSFDGIIGRDPKMLQIYRQIRDMATNDYPVNINGETGTGKELVAAAIHHESKRGNNPFVPINCGALPEGILESELFGHVKGAFTGAVRDKKGRFELANGGSLFLDEVADLPRVVQVKLLRVLQEGTFERVGGEKTISVDVRIISATNQNLKHEVEMKNFREDLYYRINVVPIHLPPLRARKGDIPLLVKHFLAQASEEGQQTDGLSKEALQIMKGYLWPGNIRELQSVIRFALVRSRGRRRAIQPGDLPEELNNQVNISPPRGPHKKLNSESVRAALTQTGGNKAKAARLLGVGRATLYRFLSTSTR